MKPHPLVVRGCIDATIAAVVLSRLASRAGRIADWLDGQADRRMRHASTLADVAAAQRSARC